MNKYDNSFWAAIPQESRTRQAQKAIFHAHCSIFLLEIRQYSFTKEILHCTQSIAF